MVINCQHSFFHKFNRQYIDLLLLLQLKQYKCELCGNEFTHNNTYTPTSELSMNASASPVMSVGIHLPMLWMYIVTNEQYTRIIDIAKDCKWNDL